MTSCDHARSGQKHICRESRACSVSAAMDLGNERGNFPGSRLSIWRLSFLVVATHRLDRDE